MAAKHLTQESFELEVLNNPNVALVDFYADWCGPCKMMGPIIDEIADECIDITVAKVNVDESPELASKYRVMTIPTLIIFKNGEILNQLIGLQSKEELVDLLENA